MTWLSDIGSYLQTGKMGTLGTDMFYSDFDLTSHNCIALIAHAGPITKTTLRMTMKLERPSLGILVRNVSNSSAETKAKEIYDYLNFTFNTTIGSTRFKSIKAVAPYFYVGQDKANNYIYSINFSLEISE